MRFFWMFLYVASVYMANRTMNDFMDLGWFGMLSVGTLYFGAVFTLRDKFHTYGLRVVFVAIALALLVNVVMAYQYDTPIRIIVASFTGILISELADTGIYQQFKAKSWLTRAMTSNAVSIPLDSFFFSFMAFYGVNSAFEFLHEGALPTTDIMKIIWADLLFKTLVAGGLALLINMYKTKRMGKQ